MIDVIKSIEEKLGAHHRPRNEIMESAIKGRLYKSLMTYEDELSAGVRHIAQKSELNVLRKL